MNECGQTPPPRAPGAEPVASQDRDAGTESVACLLHALSEYERTVARLRTAVLGLCLPGFDRGLRDAGVSRSRRTGKGKCPDG